MGILSAIVGPVSKLLDDVLLRVFPDETERDKVKAQVMQKMMESGDTYFKEAAATIRAEANSESWLARSWRPITMLSFVAIVVNNYLVAPYAAWLGYPVPTLELPPNMWSLLQIGIGGYVASRGIEKSVKFWKSKKG